MKLTLFITVLLSIVLACKNPKPDLKGIVEKGDTTKAETAVNDVPMDSASMMKAWTDFATPGEMHKMLASWNGTWHAEVLSWMDPNKPPEKSEATYTLNSILGGLYQTGHLTGTMMGTPFEGNSLLGYDNAKKVFVSTWVDNLGSGITSMTGTWDPSTNTLTLKGTQSNPMTGKETNIRETLEIVDDNTHKMTMYGTGPDGKETKFMEATYKRS
jgi:hypothetical protein